MSQLRWLITGCSSGIEETLARNILARGDKIVATGRGNVARLASLKRAGAETVALDVMSSTQDIKTAVDQIRKDGPIDVPVNNVANIEGGSAEELSYESYLSAYETNFFGVINITQAVLPHFRSRRAGCVLTIGSVAGLDGLFGGDVYCGTKFALEGWHGCLNLELAPFNIRTSILELGYFRTKIMSPGKVKYGSNRIPGHGYNGPKIGNLEKAVKIIIDLVRGEGVADLAVMRNKAVSNLALCNEWEDVIRSTNFE
ncbi:NAD(P)-binding protein [Phaeosphaeriaceae sp. SRC1lsM3a]|nr:NAD(P)-binding protein [Stagonospora sp. SRC1lsM3a]